jgi:hypothetical protein
MVDGMGSIGAGRAAAAAAAAAAEGTWKLGGPSRELGAAPAVLDSRLPQSAACAVDRAGRDCLFAPRGVRSWLSTCGSAADVLACGSERPAGIWCGRVDCFLGSSGGLDGAADVGKGGETTGADAPAVRDRRASQAADEAEDEWFGNAGRTGVGDGRASASGESTRGRRAEEDGFGDGGADDEDDSREGSEPDLVKPVGPSGRADCCGARTSVSSRSSVTPRLDVLAGSEPVSVPSSELECRWPHSPVRCRSSSTSLMNGCGGESVTAGQSCRVGRGGRALDVRGGPPALGRPPEEEAAYWP